MKQYNIAIIGATGLVGKMMIDILEEKNLPIQSITFFASRKSANKKITFRNNEYTIYELSEASLNKAFDVALFAAGSKVSEYYAPLFAKKGVVVVDNSSFFRMDINVPLVVPEVNFNVINSTHKLIANPNCTTIQAVVALKPLDDRFFIKRIVYTTYQAVSGSGISGILALKENNTFYHRAILNNVIPQVDDFLQSGYTKEEMKMINETKKILNHSTLAITATCVRVPVEVGHSLSINVEFNKPFTMHQIIEALSAAPGIVVNKENETYTTAIEAAKKDAVYVSRIRRDESVKHGINLWVVADNLRKGAALNAIQLVEKLMEDKNSE